MTESVKLLSSMIPTIKPKINSKHIKKKVPSKLTLKTNIRRTSVLDSLKPTLKQVDLNIIECSSSETVSSGSSVPSIIDDTVITISDNDSYEDLKKNVARAPVKKYVDIKKWIDEVNDKLIENLRISTPINSELSQPSLEFNKNVRSIFINTEPRKKYNKNPEFNRNLEASSVPAKKKNNSSDCSFGDLFSDDSLNLNESLYTRLTKTKSGNDLKKSKVCDDLLDDEEIKEIENVLDDVYGNSWRENKEQILPKSEPRVKLPVETKVYPKTELKIKDSNPIVPKKSNVRTKLNFNDIKPDDPLDKKQYRRIRQLSSSSSEQEIVIKPKKENKKVQIKSFSSSSSETSSVGNRKLPKSFLASLSGSVPLSECDPSAKFYRNNYAKYKDELVKKLFKLYNEKIFDKSIPEETPFDWNPRMRGTAGYCYCKKVNRGTVCIERKVQIVLAEKVLDSADRLRDTLVHELCHAAAWIVNQVADGHGPYWKAWANKAMRVFPELPPIKRSHDYVIHTKYTYRCTSCGYSIGRHRKSINIEGKRCGYCYGKFEVFTTRKKNGIVTNVPVTPKKAATGFALFVQKNYAEVRTPQLDHGDTMKMLGQKFTEMKFATQ